MKRIYLAKDKRSGFEYNKYIGRVFLPKKQGQIIIRKVRVIDQITNTYITETVDLHITSITKKAI